MPLHILHKIFDIIKTIVGSIHEGKKLRAKMYMSAHTNEDK